MMDSGFLIKDMDLENTHGLLVINKVMSLRVTGAMIKRMDKVQ